MAFDRNGFAKLSKLQWGELDDEDLDFLLPPRQVISPDDNGTKKVIEYKFNEDGKTVKITTTTQVRKLAKARLSKSAVERRNWAKFGDAVHGARLPTLSPEEILLERPRAPGNEGEETKVAGDDLAQLGKGGAVLMVCRICGKKGDHWTSRCPYKDLAQPVETIVDKPPAAEPTTTAGAYVPPSMRNTTEMRRWNEENYSCRVTNLSEDTWEPDLLELFGAFGPVSRTHVAIDRKTGSSRGFGYVDFANKEDAERAISKLNGYGYDNLILRLNGRHPEQTKTFSSLVY